VERGKKQFSVKEGWLKIMSFLLPFMPLYAQLVFKANLVQLPESGPSDHIVKLDLVRCHKRRAEFATVDIGSMHEASDRSRELLVLISMIQHQFIRVFPFEGIHFYITIILSHHCGN
jgi:hypothetical protein